MEQLITTEQEQIAQHLAVALRSLRKWGFHLVQHPDAAARPQDFQERQAVEAACLLIGIPASKEHAANYAVHELAQALLQNATASEGLLRK